MKITELWHRQQLLIILMLPACGSLQTRVRPRYSWLESCREGASIKHLRDTGDKGPRRISLPGPAIR